MKHRYNFYQIFGLASKHKTAINGDVAYQNHF